MTVELTGQATKVCSHCKIEKPKNEFYNSKTRKDGLTPQCKICHDAASKRRREPTRDLEKGLKRCPLCQNWLPFDRFRSGGTSSYCRACQANYQRSQNAPSGNIALKRKLFTEIPGDPADYKWCTLGKNYHLKSEFNQNKARPDGLETSCGACRREYTQKRKALS